MPHRDIRWKQRFANFKRALLKLHTVVQNIDCSNRESEIALQSSLSDLEKEGVIQRFEYIHELAWNVMKDYLEYQGNTNISGSRDTIRESFKAHLIEDGEVWMDMIKSRNQTSHTYNEGTAEEIFFKIIDSYYGAFVNFQKRMEGLDRGEELGI